MNVYEILIANAGDITVVLVEASHIGVAVGRAVRRKRRVPRDTYLKVLARRVAEGKTVEEYTSGQNKYQKGYPSDSGADHMKRKP